MSNPETSSEFLDLFTRSQLRLYRYIVMLVANQTEAEDILQNANLVMLKKCDQFQAGTNFLAWSAGIAYLEVLKYRTRENGSRRGLSEATLEMLAAEALARTRSLERRNAALPDCMEKLPSADLTLVTDHYFRGLSWETIARPWAERRVPCGTRSAASARTEDMY